MRVQAKKERRAARKCVRAVKVILVAPGSPLLDRSYRFVELEGYRYLKTRSRPTVVFNLLDCSHRPPKRKTNK